MLPSQTKRVREAWKRYSGTNSRHMPQFVEQFIHSANITCLRTPRKSKTHEVTWCIPHLCVDEARFMQEISLGSTLRFYPTKSKKIYVTNGQDGFICVGKALLEIKIAKLKTGYVNWYNVSYDIAWSKPGYNDLRITAMEEEIGRMTDKISVLYGSMRSLATSIELLTQMVAELSKPAKPLPPVPVIGPAPPSRCASEEES